MTLIRNCALAAALAVLGACASAETTRPMPREAIPGGAASTSTSSSSSTATAAKLVPATPSKDYPLNTCIVSGNPLGARPLAYTWNGREVQFCCTGCIATFEKNPEKYMAKLDASGK